MSFGLTFLLISAALFFTGAFKNPPLGTLDFDHLEPSVKENLKFWIKEEDEFGLTMELKDVVSPPKYAGTLHVSCVISPRWVDRDFIFVMDVIDRCTNERSFRFEHVVQSARLTKEQGNSVFFDIPLDQVELLSNQIIMYFWNPNSQAFFVEHLVFDFHE